MALRGQQGQQHGLAGVQAVLGFIPHHALRPVDDGGGDFFHPYGMDYMLHGQALLLGESYLGRRVHDLLAVLDDFDPDKAEAHLRNLANPAPVLRLSARKELDMEAWYTWLREQLAAQRALVAKGQSRRPAIQGDGQKFHSTTAR